MLDEQRPRFEERVRALAAFGHRGSTTDRERAAADYLCQQVASLGLTPEREAFLGSSSFGGRILIHVLVAVAAALLFWVSPAVSPCWAP